MKKKVLAVILTVAILSSLVVTAAGAASVSDFADVSSDSWYYESVDFVSSKGYMIGVGTTPETFAPEYNMTRAMFVTVLARVAGVKVDNTKSSFDDVKVNEWYTGAVAWAVEAGVTTGVGGNNFAPDAFVTREDMATFMSRFVAWYSKTTGNSHRNKALVESFTDAASIRDYAKDAVEQCRQWGLINGYDNGAFGPQDFSTRAQVAAVISRLYWIVNAGGGPLDKYTDYEVEATIKVPASLNVGDSELLLTNTYKNVTTNGKITNDVSIDKIMSDLISGENKTIITNAIKQAINKATLNGAGRTGKDAITVTVSGETVTIEISKEGVISATTTANGIVDSATTNTSNDGTQGTAAATTEYEELVQRLQNGGTITTADLGTLEELIAKANSVTDDNIGGLIDKYVNGNPAYEQAIEGLNNDDIVKAAQEYAEKLEDVKSDVKASETGSVEVEPIVLTVAVDLSAYVARASETYNNKWTKSTSANGVTYPAISEKIQSVLANHSLAEADIAKIVDLAEAAYKANDPVYFLTDNGNGTLSIKGYADYYGMIENNVNKAIDIYKALNSAITTAGKTQSTFYANAYTRANDVLANKDIKSLTIGGSVTAEIFGAMVDAINTDNGEGVFAACENEDGTATTFTVNFNANPDLYDSIRETYGYLPETLPEKATNLFGNYTIEVTITESAEHY